MEDSSHQLRWLERGLERILARTHFCSTPSRPSLPSSLVCPLALYLSQQLAQPLHLGLCHGHLLGDASRGCVIPRLLPHGRSEALGEVARGDGLEASALAGTGGGQDECAMLMNIIDRR